MVYWRKSGIPTDFSVHKKPSDLYFSIKNNYTELSVAGKMQEKFRKKSWVKQKRLKNSKDQETVLYIIEMFYKPRNSV